MNGSWPISIAFGIASVVTTRRNQNKHRYLSRRLWAVEFVFDLGSMVFMPGWWKFLGVIPVIISARALTNPSGMHDLVRKIMYRKLAKLTVEIYKFDNKQPDVYLERAVEFLEREDMP
jgi:hypothetical protein